MRAPSAAVSGEVSNAAPAWVVPAMRAGYLARAIVFGLIGFSAAHAAWVGGHAEGPEGALVSLLDESLGIPLLWAIAAGAFGFAIWGFLAALMDLDCRGRDAQGIFSRIDFAATGLIYIAIAVFVGDLAAKGYISGSEEGSRERGTAWLLSLPAGGWIVIIVGIGFIAAGVWFGYKGITGKYRERLRDTPTVKRLDPVCKFGWTAYGVVVVILGSFLLWAGWTLDASKAGGFAEAFAIVRQAVFGLLLLLLLGFGFAAFAIECLVEATYRIVPARHGADVPTLASRMPRNARRGIVASE